MSYYSALLSMYATLFFFLFYFFFFYRSMSSSSFFFFFSVLYVFFLFVFIQFILNNSTNSSTFIKNSVWFSLSKSTNIFFSLDLNYYNLEFSFILFFLALNIHLYSFHYFKKEVEFFRFSNLIGFFLFFMFLLINTTSLTFFFISWEGIGLFSFLLVNFWYSKVNTFKASMKVLFYNRVGDFFFFFSIYLLSNVIKSDSFLTLSLDYFSVLSFKINFFNSLYIKNFLIFCFFIVILSKSAQFGFHIWLLEAMEAPLPASSLIHSATLVCAGVVLFFKINFFSFFNSFFLWFIITWATMTSLFLSVSALFNYDIKKILAYSTGSHISIMLVASAGCSLNLAFAYLLIHASSKVFIFLLFGYIIDINGSVRDLRKMGGFYFNNYIFNFIFLAVFSLSSLPFFALGFLKDSYYIFLLKNNFFWDLITVLLGAASLANYMYMFRLFFKIFFGDRLSFSYTYFKNLFFKNRLVVLNTKSYFKSAYNSNVFTLLSYFILFNLFFFISFIEFSSLNTLKHSAMHFFWVAYSSTNYTSLNSFFLFLANSNSYILISLIFILFFLKKQ